jgi:hypothetical protein
VIRSFLATAVGITPANTSKWLDENAGCLL